MVDTVNRHKAVADTVIYHKLLFPFLFFCRKDSFKVSARKLCFPCRKTYCIFWSPAREDVLYVKLKTSYEDTNYLMTLKAFISVIHHSLLQNSNLNLKTLLLHTCILNHILFSLEMLSSCTVHAPNSYYRRCRTRSYLYMDKIFKIASLANSACFQTKNAIFKKWLSYLNLKCTLKIFLVTLF